jgi:cytidylate kinase
VSRDAAVVTIDGPSGSGKGTVSRLLARRLGWQLLDSGALYRLVALAAAERGVPLDEEGRLAELARNLDVYFASDEASGERILLEGRDVGAKIRTESCGDRASQVAKLPDVRDALVELQRSFCRPPGLVADGRDMGTRIFPDATLKVFLTASPEERARRRHKQLIEKGIDVNLAALSADIAERDRRDAERTVAPLEPARDARVLDSTDLGIPEVVDQILRWLERLIPLPPVNQA